MGRRSPELPDYEDPVEDASALAAPPPRTPARRDPEVRTTPELAPLTESVAACCRGAGLLSASEAGWLGGWVACARAHVSLACARNAPCG